MKIILRLILIIALRSGHFSNLKTSWLSVTLLLTKWDKSKVAVPAILTPLIINPTKNKSILKEKFRIIT